MIDNSLIMDDLISYTKKVADGHLTNSQVNKQGGIFCIYSHSRAFKFFV